jgi:hypothetical protein
MPINPIVLQRRHAELGRIRLGDKGDRGQPQKLDRFRFTSPLERHIRDLATLYGGTPQEWQNGNATEWEVYTDSTSIPVVVVKGGLSQWMETWSGGGCVHRCDGVTMEDGTPCEQDQTTITIKNQTHRAHDVAKPTTRLSVMLPELEAIGVWRLESKGWNAAATLPNMHDLAAYLGELVPARLMLKEQKTIKDGRTNRFVVPVLDLEVSASRLTALVQQANSGQVSAIEQQGETRAIGSARPSWIDEELAQCQTPDDVRAVWQRVNQAGLMNEAMAAYLTGRAEELKPVESTVDGVVEDAGDIDTAWSAMVAEAGKHGLTAPQIDALLLDRYAMPPDQLDQTQLESFTADLKAGKVAA